MTGKPTYDMKKLILLLFIPLVSFGQVEYDDYDEVIEDIQNRIVLIKQMYKETNRLLEKENVICKKIEAVEYDDYDEVIIAEKKIKYCDLKSGYSKITIEIYGPSLNDYEEHYFRYNNLYFSYLKLSDEGGETTIRHYFNSSGDLIRNLKDDGSGNKNIYSGPYLYELHYAQDILLNDKN